MKETEADRLAENLLRFMERQATPETNMFDVLTAVMLALHAYLRVIDGDDVPKRIVNFKNELSLILGSMSIAELMKEPPNDRIN